MGRVEMRLTQGLCRAASVRPNGLATVDGDRRRSWREVQDRVARGAAALRALGAGAGAHVAVLAMNGDAFFEAYFAILWAGAVIVPLNTRLAAAELAWQLADAEVGILLYGEEFAALVDELRPALPASLVTVALGAETQGSPSYQRAVETAAPAPEVARTNGDLAGIFYTGGTTGRPKGVMLTHQALSAMAMNLIMATKIDDRCVNLHAAPMFHLADIGIFMCTMVAGTHVFIPRLTDDAILDAVVAHRVTHIFTVPVVIERLARHPRSATVDLSSLRILGYGGAPMPAGGLALARQVFPQVDFIQGFGMTEMAAHTFLGPEAHRPDADPARLRSAGQACYGFELRIVGPDGAELPRGQLGEIVGRGDNLMTGYWKQPEATDAALRDGWMHTGDAGYMDDEGYVFITDRFKDMIISGAENIYSLEVENVLSQHPAVQECAVIGVPDDAWGERVHAIIVPKPGMTVALDELANYARQHIAGYKVPRSLEIRDEPLPRAAAGKVLKASLRAPYWRGRDRAV